jgi:hypothetical protein
VLPKLSYTEVLTIAGLTTAVQQAVSLGLHTMLQLALTPAAPRPEQAPVPAALIAALSAADRTAHRISNRTAARPSLTPDSSSPPLPAASCRGMPLPGRDDRGSVLGGEAGAARSAEVALHAPLRAPTPHELTSPCPILRDATGTGAPASRQGSPAGDESPVLTAVSVRACLPEEEEGMEAPAASTDIEFALSPSAMPSAMSRVPIPTALPPAPTPALSANRRNSEEMPFGDWCRSRRCRSRVRSCCRGSATSYRSGWLLPRRHTAITGCSEQRDRVALSPCTGSVSVCPRARP